MTKIIDELGALYLVTAEAYDSITFNKSTKIHDWRNYIPIGLVNRWDELSDEAKFCAIVVVAWEIAEKEEWD